MAMSFSVPTTYFKTATSGFDRQANWNKLVGVSLRGLFYDRCGCLAADNRHTIQSVLINKNDQSSLPFDLAARFGTNSPMLAARWEFPKVPLNFLAVGLLTYFTRLEDNVYTLIYESTFFVSLSMFLLYTLKYSPSILPCIFSVIRQRHDTCLLDLSTACT